MKTGRVFWGVFFLTLGVAFLLERFGVMQLQWHHAWRYWPVVLIAWGAAILLGGKILRLIAVIVAAAVLALVVVAVLSFSWDDEGWDGKTVTQDQEFREEYTPGAATASFSLESGAGSFVVGDTTSGFVEARTTSSLGKYELERNGAGGKEFVLRLNGTHKGWFHRRMHNEASVRLHAGPVWDLDFDIGAAKLRCDLTPFKVEQLNVDCGAADVDLRLGRGVPRTTAKINAGVSSLRIAVPRESGCELRIDAPLSGKNIDGFTRLEKGHYQTENFSLAEEHITIEIDAGVSSIRVERY